MTKTIPTVLSTSQPERMTDNDADELFLEGVEKSLPRYVSNRARLLASAALSDIKDEPRGEDENYYLAQWFDAALAATPAVSGEAEPCPYCSDGKRTGLPGNACENCMNTGLKYPERAATPAVGGEVREEMQESGTADAFEEADFAILYREIPESGTKTLQEITNVPQVFCREIARLLAQPASPLRGRDTELLDWLNEQIVSEIYLDDGRLIDVRGNDIRSAIRALVSASPPEQPAADQVAKETM